MIARYKIGVRLRDLFLKTGSNKANNDRSFILSQFPESFTGIWTWDGRSALRLLFRHLNLKEDEEVLLPRLTCSYVRDMIRWCGGRERYVEITHGFYPDEEDYIEAARYSSARIIVVVSCFGVPVDCRKIKEALPGHRIIKDAALSFGSRHSDGTIDGADADMAILSFGPGKPFSLGAGGLALIKSGTISSVETQSDFNIQPPSRFVEWNEAVRVFFKSLIIDSRWMYGLYRKVRPYQPEYAGNMDYRGPKDGLRATVYGLPSWFDNILYSKLSRINRFSATEKMEQLFPVSRNSGVLRELINGIESDNVTLLDESGWNTSFTVLLFSSAKPEILHHLAREINRSGIECILPYIDMGTAENTPPWILLPAPALLKTTHARKIAAIINKELSHTS